MGVGVDEPPVTHGLPMLFTKDERVVLHPVTLPIRSKQLNEEIRKPEL